MDGLDLYLVRLFLYLFRSTQVKMVANKKGREW